jgi:hypothetical protein
MSDRSIGADDLLRAEAIPPEETSQKIITSDHNGFAGVRPPITATSSENMTLDAYRFGYSFKTFLIQIRITAVKLVTSSQEP